MSAEFKFGDLYYEFIDGATNEVMVYPHIEGDNIIADYEGDIVIPGVVSFEGKDYDVTKICEYAFCNCNKVTSISMPSSIREIGQEAFEGCTSLTTLELPEGLEYIAAGAFFRVPLTSLNIPASCVSFGSDRTMPLPSIALQGLTALKNITVAAGNPRYSSRDGLLLSADGGTLEYCPENKFERFAVPDYVSIVGNGAFMRSKIKELTISGTVATIYTTAFNNASFETLIFERGDQDLKIVLKDWMTANPGLGLNTLRRVVYSREKTDGSLTNMSGDLYDFVLTCDSRDMTSQFFKDLASQSSVFELGDNVDSDCFIYDEALYSLKDGSSAGILQAWPGKSMTESVNVHSECSTIGISAFANTRIKNICLPESVCEIDEGAFAGSAIEAIRLGRNVSRLGEGIFQDCKSLAEVSMLGGHVSEDGTVGVPANTFKGCTALKKAYFGERISCFESFAMSSVESGADIYMRNPVHPAYKNYSMGMSTQLAKTVTLHVPTGSLDDYKSYAGNRYFNILEFDYSGIGNVVDDGNVEVAVVDGGLEVSGCETVEIFTASGLRVYYGTSGRIVLTPGFYIVNAGNVVRKVRL